MKYFSLISLISIVSLTACTPVIAPIDEVAQVTSKKEAVRTQAYARKTVEYVCKGGKTVSLLLPYDKQAKKITLTFNQVSHKLSLMLAPAGKKYSNIRWTWHETPNGVGTLQNNRKIVLAEHCVPKEQK